MLKKISDFINELKSANENKERNLHIYQKRSELLGEIALLKTVEKNKIISFVVNVFIIEKLWKDLHELISAPGLDARIRSAMLEKLIITSEELVAPLNKDISEYFWADKINKKHQIELLHHAPIKVQISLFRYQIRKLQQMQKEYQKKTRKLEDKAHNLFDLLRQFNELIPSLADELSDAVKSLQSEIVTASIYLILEYDIRPENFQKHVSAIMDDSAVRLDKNALLSFLYEKGLLVKFYNSAVIWSDKLKIIKELAFNRNLSVLKDVLNIEVMIEDGKLEDRISLLYKIYELIRHSYIDDTFKNEWLIFLQKQALKLTLCRLENEEISKQAVHEIINFAKISDFSNGLANHAGKVFKSIPDKNERNELIQTLLESSEQNKLLCLMDALPEYRNIITMRLASELLDPKSNQHIENINSILDRYWRHFWLFGLEDYKNSLRRLAEERIEKELQEQRELSLLINEIRRICNEFKVYNWTSEIMDGIFTDLDELEKTAVVQSIALSPLAATNQPSIATNRVIVQWIKKTSLFHYFGEKEIGPTELIDCLLAIPSEERDKLTNSVLDLALSLVQTAQKDEIALKLIAILLKIFPGMKEKILDEAESDNSWLVGPVGELLGIINKEICQETELVDAVKMGQKSLRSVFESLSSQNSLLLASSPQFLLAVERDALEKTAVHCLFDLIRVLREELEDTKKSSVAIRSNPLKKISTFIGKRMVDAEMLVSSYVLFRRRMESLGLMRAINNIGESIYTHELTGDVKVVGENQWKAPAKLLIRTYGLRVDGQENAIYPAIAEPFTE